MIGPIQARLTLAEEERAVLISRQPGSQHKITPEFFTVLEKVARIKADCQVIIIRMFLPPHYHESGAAVSWSPGCSPEHHGSDVRPAGGCSGQVSLPVSISHYNPLSCHQIVSLGPGHCPQH